MSTLRIALAVTVLAAALCSPAAAAAYTVTDLGQGQAYGINSSGEVVGTFGLYNGGVTTPLGGTAYGINDSGQVVGTFGLYSGGATIGLAGTGYAINNAGYVVGQNSGQGQAYVYNINDRRTYGLGTLGGATSCAYGINSAGQVVGGSLPANSGGYPNLPNPFTCTTTTYRGHIIGSTMTNLLTYTSLPSFDYQYWPSQAQGINNAGTIVGYMYDSNFIAFQYSNGALTVLGTLAGLNPPEGAPVWCGYSYAEAINNAGQIVGASTPGSSEQAYFGPLHAFIYDNGVMTDLNNLIDPTLGWTLEYAQAINDNGQIVGYGIGPDGNTDAFLLTPTPEPATMSLLAVGLAALVARRRRS